MTGEVCGDGEDNDQDGDRDCADTECACTAECVGEWLRPESADNLLSAAGFEGIDAAAFGEALPSEAGVWSGDVVTVVTGSEDGSIAPREGAGMLQFLSATPSGMASSSRAGELFQLVDVSGLAGETLCAAGWFARIEGEEDNQFDVRLIIYEGGPEEFAAQLDAGVQMNCGETERCDQVSAEVAEVVWTPLATSLRVPDVDGPITAMVKLTARENVSNELEGQEFPGNFADDVWLSVVP